MAERRVRRTGAGIAGQRRTKAGADSYYASPQPEEALRGAHTKTRQFFDCRGIVLPMTPLRYSVAFPQDSLALSTESVANQLIFEGERSMLLNAAIGQCTE